ncbi:unnamed protein product, partial [Ascophyllum nodosum]
AGGAGRGDPLDEERRYVYIAAMHLFPIKLNFSFIKNADVKELFRLQDRGDGRVRASPHFRSLGLSSSFPRLLLEFVINLTNDISPS